VSKPRDLLAQPPLKADAVALTTLGAPQDLTLSDRGGSAADGVVAAPALEGEDFTVVSCMSLLRRAGDKNSKRAILHIHPGHFGVD
jgi:hypothetical protein